METRAAIEKKIAKLTGKLNKVIKGQNAAFWRMSKTQQRISVAKDVLAQIKAETIRAKPGTYLSTKDLTKVDVENGDAQLSALLPRIESCDACALGSMFKCAVERGDKLKVSESDAAVAEYYGGRVFFWKTAPYEYLGKIFPAAQIHLIESCFERSVDFWTEHSTDDVPVDVSVYGPRGDRKRLEMIMKNIIRNRGVFKPEQDMKGRA